MLLRTSIQHSAVAEEGQTNDDRRWEAALVHCGLPVGFGALIYLVYRSPTLLVYRALIGLGLSGSLEWIRHLAATHPLPFPRQLLFTLPDGLWVYALTACMGLIWRGEEGWPRRPWQLAGLIFGAGGEIGQWMGIVPGTFDTLDLAAIILGFAGALLLSSGKGTRCGSTSSRCWR